MKRSLLVLCVILFASVLQPQSLTEVVLPLYIQGLNGTNSTRLPFAYLVKLSGLSPNVTYFYINQIVIGTDAETSNGAGNCIFVNSNGTFTRTSSPDVSISGQHGEFVTDASGNFTGWFINEPTGNKTRFVPGNEVFMRIGLNDGNGGTVIVTRLTTTSSVKVINFGNTASAVEGTGIYGVSVSDSMQFVFLYDNSDGTGRPIAGTFIENDGIDNSASNNYAQFYSDFVNGVNGAWGTIIPNVLANGIHRIERRSLADGSILPGTAIDDDGIWANGANTVNPTGGLTPIVIDAALPVELNSFSAVISNKEVHLNWSTATEINNSGFEIYRKKENRSWQKIGFVEGKGNSAEKLNYAFIDKTLSETGNYVYRLKQIDLNGNYKYSGEVEVKYAKEKQFRLVQNYPNPFNPSTKIVFELPAKSMVNLSVYNIIGQKVATLVNQQLEDGVYERTFNAENLPAGIYIYTLKTDNASLTGKMLLMK